MESRREHRFIQVYIVIASLTAPLAAPLPAGVESAALKAYNNSQKCHVQFLLLHAVSGQELKVDVSGNGICETVHCRNLNCLRSVDKCVTIVGNFTFIYYGLQKPDMFSNMTLWNLKEITGYMAIYQVPVLESIGQLFPNLVRIRGRDLLNNYALIIYDINQLNEINLYSLLKIDRGGVIIWGGPSTCNIDTIDWKTIAPRYRHVLSPADDNAPCDRICRCTSNPAYNYCWNRDKCQRFTEGPEALKCNNECLGCRLTNPNECWLCRHYTYRQQCVPKCPNDTIILEDNQYCITEEECHELNRWEWNNTCVNACPDNYVRRNITKGEKTSLTCEPCPDCKEYCGNISITSLGSIQAAHRCVYINGSLSIHIRGVPEAIEEMNIHLSRIQEVYDYIIIHDSISLGAVDFLPSLKRIRGQKLIDNKYSLVIRDNPNLQTVFRPNVTKYLKIDKGAIDILRNPMLCMSEIVHLKKLFPQPTNGAQDVPHGYGLNAYSGCEDVSLGIKVKKINQTSAVVKFVPVPNTKMHYTVLYVRVPPGKCTSVVPETCSEYEWQAVTTDDSGRTQLSNLRPASTYLVCIESYDADEKHLNRSSIVNFSTTAGKPEPPFIMELVADTPHLVVLHWIDHVDYVPHITRYELSVSLIDIHPEDITASNQCKNMAEVLEEDDVSRHAVVMRPPRDYGKGCESMCGILSTAPHGAMVEEDFNICNSMGSVCDEIHEEPSVTNTSFGYFIRTMSLSINGPRTAYQIGDLAPYRDYRFRLRACTKDLCSRSTRGVVRTLPSMVADAPTISASEVDKTGYITVSWQAPEVSNGPVLAYILKLMPDIKGRDVGTQQTEIWCVPANQTKLVVNSEKLRDYVVQVCSMSLASRSGCSELKKLLGTPPQAKDLMWAGVLFALSLCITSVLGGYLWTTCRTQSDTVPLVDITSSYRIDSEPPIFSLLDFTPSLHVSRTDLNDIYNH